MGIAGSARDSEHIVNRIAEESDTVVISVEYRLAPEHKAPAAIYDGYGAVKWIIENSESLRILPEHVGVMGVGAGGWVVVGLGMLLAENGESDLIKY